ncbi:hypothetical protein CR513_47362, partial [Mucuna pruriens]
MASPNPNKRIKKMATRDDKKVSSGGQSSKYNRWFSSEEHINRYNNFFSFRKIVIPKVISLNQFENQGFDFPEFLKFQGLQSFVEMEGGFYPVLVKVFYSNARLENSKIITEVKKKKIVLDENVWREVAGLKSGGLKVSDLNAQELRGFDRTRVYRETLINPDEEDKDRYLAEGMKVEERLISVIIALLLMPRGSNHEQVTTDDLLLLYALKNHIQLDWGFIFKQTIIKASMNSDAQLPYAIMVSRVIDHFGIDVSNESTVFLKKRNRITESLLHRMGLECVQGIWISTGDEGEVPQAIVGPIPPSKSLILQRVEEVIALQKSHQEENRLKFDVCYSSVQPLSTIGVVRPYPQPGYRNCGSKAV